MEVNGYEGFMLVGSGGNAHVYRATDTSTGDVVAVKVLRGGGDESVTRRFERERSLMAELETITNVVPIHESGIDESGDPYLVMPLYSGGSLQDRVESGPMPWREAVEMTKTLTESIALAHAKRILHLDIKPANVLLDSDGRPWLADFGIAEMMGHTASMSAQMMTPAFTPPERLDGAKPGEQTDLYGLMATLYALLTSRAPYVSDAMTGPMGVMMAILRDPLPLEHLSADTPESVRNLLMRGMAKDPAERPRSAIELVGLLEDVLDGRDIAPPIALGAATAEVAPNLPAVIPDAHGTVVVGQSASQSLMSTPAGAGDEDSSRRGLVLAGLALVFLVAGGAIAAFVLGGGGDGDEVAASSSSTTDPSAETVAVAAASVENTPEDDVTVEVSGDGQSIVSDEPTTDAAAGSGEADDAGTATSDDASSPTTAATAAATPTTRAAAPTTTRAAAADDDTTTTTERATTTTTEKATTTTKQSTTTSSSTTSSSTTTSSTTTAKPAVTTPPLEAGFRASKGPTGSEQTISFANITIGTATSYRWDFGDGNTSTQTAPSHTYASPGTYSVTITAMGPDGSDSATHSVRVDPNTVQFEAGWTASASPSPNQQTVNFRSITIGPVSSITWDFGDGSTGSGATVSHTYAAPGTYSVTITATGSEGTDTATHSVRVDANG